MKKIPERNIDNVNNTDRFHSLTHELESGFHEHRTPQEATSTAATLTYDTRLSELIDQFFLLQYLQNNAFRTYLNSSNSSNMHNSSNNNPNNGILRPEPQYPSCTYPTITASITESSETSDDEATTESSETSYDEIPPESPETSYEDRIQSWLATIEQPSIETAMDFDNLSSLSVISKKM
jgi:hypothetical protein